MFQSTLKIAIAKGLKPGGNLEEELLELNDYVINSRRDAKAICNALAQFPREGSTSEETKSDLEALCGLFQQVEGPHSPAFQVLSLEGHRQLFRIYDVLIKKPEAEEGNELMHCLKTFAMYGSIKGAEKVVEAAKLPFNPESYFWNVIFEIFDSEHQHCEFVYRELSETIPPGFAGVTFLDGANNAMLEGGLKIHPFASPSGIARLREYIQNSDPDNYSYAVSAAVALAFLNDEVRNDLIALVWQHPDPKVRIEGAWAAAKSGDQSGFLRLTEYCETSAQSVLAQSYLEELGRADLIPASAKEPEFLALSEFANWLSHPNELGKAPDELKIVDRRDLKWPTESQAKPFTLIRYRLKDQTGLEADDVDCGLVGSMTWCFFSYQMNQRPPEDVYAIHCYWEMTGDDLIVESDEIESAEYDSMLGQWQGVSLEKPVITKVADLSPKLGYPSRMVAVAMAHLKGVEGWAILDGDRSKWYPKGDFPDETNANTILKIHVGRYLLGFSEEPNRKKYLKNVEPVPPASTFVKNYEKLLLKLEQAPSGEVPDLVKSYGPLANHFEKYVDSLTETSGCPKVEVILEAYERILRKADQCEPSLHEKVFDSFTLPGSQLESYLDALIESGRQDEVQLIIGRFEPYWNHNWGHGVLGKVTYQIGDLDAAERHLVFVRENLDDWGRDESMDLLAGLWTKKGKKDEARDLLLDCMKQVQALFNTSDYPSDRIRHVGEYQTRRTTFLNLFPDDEEAIAKAGLPDTLGTE